MCAPAVRVPAVAPTGRSATARCSRATPAIETIIEFAHRTTSGVALLLVVGLVVLARRDFPAGHLVRRAAWASLFFMVTEALVGAGIVLLELVADNDSAARAVYLGVHLVNTFLLLAAMTLTAWWGSGPAGTAAAHRLAPAGAARWGPGGTPAGGDHRGHHGARATRFFRRVPWPRGCGRIRLPPRTILLRLRVLHPMLAITGWRGTADARRARNPCGRRLLPRPSWGASRRAWYWLQLIAGVLNLLLLAPIWMQLVHLFLADLVWLSAVLLTACAAAEVAPAASGSQSPALDYRHCASVGS